LQAYLQLKPKSVDALDELAAQQQLLSQSLGTDLENIEIDAQTVAPQSIFTPSGTTGLAPLFTSTNALEDPIATAVTAATQTDVANARQKLLDNESETQTTF